MHRDVTTHGKKVKKGICRKVMYAVVLLDPFGIF